MNKIKTLFMFKKPALNDFAKPEMSKKAKIVFLASFEGAKKDQDRILKKAKALSK